LWTAAVKRSSIVYSGSSLIISFKIDRILSSLVHAMRLGKMQA
jgi:hypothetical protein